MQLPMCFGSWQSENRWKGYDREELTGGRKMASSCEMCGNYEYDEEYGEWTCSVAMDEDDLARVAERSYKECPYFQFADEYQIVRKQM